VKVKGEIQLLGQQVAGAKVKEEQIWSLLESRSHEKLKDSGF